MIPAIISSTENHITLNMCLKNRLTPIKQQITGMTVYHQMSTVGVVCIQCVSMCEIHWPNIAAVKPGGVMVGCLVGNGLPDIGVAYLRWVLYKTDIHGEILCFVYKYTNS
jgi:hypothetical protein